MYYYRSVIGERHCAKSLCCVDGNVVRICCVMWSGQNVAAGSSPYAVCPSCCGVIPRRQCGPSPPLHVVGCARHCSAPSPGLTRPSPPLMQHAPTTGHSASGFQQLPTQHAHDCPSCHLPVDDRPPLSLEPAYHPGSWPDPVTVQCPIHGCYQPFVAGFHQTVCSTDHLHFTHPHQFICHHQQSQQPLSHVYQASYAVQSPPPPSQCVYGTVPLGSGVDVDLAATSRGDWYHPCVEYQHQPDCQLLSQPVTVPVMQHPQQQHNVPGVELAKTDADTCNQRLQLSVWSADDADTSRSMTNHDQLITAVADAADVAACNAGEIHLSS